MLMLEMVRPLMVKAEGWGGLKTAGRLIDRGVFLANRG